MSRMSRPMIRTLAVGLLMAACSPEAEDSGWAPQVKDADSSSGGGDGGSTDVAAASGMSGQWLLGTDWSTCVSFGSAPIAASVRVRSRKVTKVVFMAPASAGTSSGYYYAKNVSR